MTDHKPLVRILGDKSLDKISNPRVFRFKENTLRYDFKIMYVEGKCNGAADACSRNPVNEEGSHIHLIRSVPTDNEIGKAIDLDVEIEATVIGMITSSCGQDVNAVTLERVKSASSEDKHISELKRFITSGFPSTNDQLPENLRRFWGIKDELSILDGVVLYGYRILIPASLRILRGSFLIIIIKEKNSK